jgi:outer membrane lipoprotein carrier protein
MWTFYQRLVCAAFLLVAALASANAQAQAQPEPLQLLGDFIRTVQSGRAQFTQTVISPAREGQSVRSRNSSGVFEFARPNKFRFSYSKPYVQTLVADGQTLWLHDPDLNQVTARKLSQVLQNLVMNGIQAMPHGGYMDVDVKNIAIAAPGDGAGGSDDNERMPRVLPAAKATFSHGTCLHRAHMAVQRRRAAQAARQ